MRLISFSDWNAFLTCLDGLLDEPQVQIMRSLPHHPGVNCYEHSVFVAYVAFRLARRWNLDYRSCTTCTSTAGTIKAPTPACSALTTRSLPCATPAS